MNTLPKHLAYLQKWKMIDHKKKDDYGNHQYKKGAGGLVATIEDQTKISKF